MQEITTIIALIQDAGFIGILVVLAIPRLRGFVFNGSLQSQQPQIDVLKEHAKTSNTEVGKIQKDIVIIKEDIIEMKESLSFIKGKIDK